MRIKTKIRSVSRRKLNERKQSQDVEKLIDNPATLDEESCLSHKVEDFTIDSRMTYNKKNLWRDYFPHHDDVYCNSEVDDEDTIPFLANKSLEVRLSPDKFSENSAHK